MCSGKTKRFAIKCFFVSPPTSRTNRSPSWSILARPAICLPSRIGKRFGIIVIASKSAPSMRSSSGNEFFIFEPLFGGGARSAGIGRPAPLTAGLDRARSLFAGAGASLEPPFSSDPGTESVATFELGIDQLAIPLPPFGLRLGFDRAQW
jgi:hypothetical protein